LTLYTFYVTTHFKYKDTNIRHTPQYIAHHNRTEPIPMAALAESPGKEDPEHLVSKPPELIESAHPSEAAVLGSIGATVLHAAPRPGVELTYLQMTGDSAEG
jgi:hypothetical protein